MAQHNNTLSTQKLNDLQTKIWNRVVMEEQFRNPDYSARQLATDLGTNTRYISETLQLRFGKSFPAFVNQWRVEAAARLIASKQGENLTFDAVARMVGFANRQTLHTAFVRQMGCSPKAYRDAQK